MIDTLNNNPGLVVLAYTAGTLAVVIVSTWAVLEQRKLRRAQFRPIVTADMELDGERHVAFFYLRNVGTATARDVRISIDPPLENPNNPELSVTPELHPWLARGLPVMVPGKQIRTLMAIYGDYPLDGAIHKVHIRYEAEGRRKGFEETFEIDMEALMSVKPSEPKGPHTIAEELKAQNKLLTGAATSLREIATHVLGLEEH